MLINVSDHPTTTRQRQRLIADLMAAGTEKPSDLLAELRARGVTNKGGRSFSLSTVRNDVKALQAAQPVTEIINRVVTTTPYWKAKASKAFDATQSDYEFWDELRRGKADGFAFGALFAMPLTQIIASFVFGSGVSAQLSDSVEGNASNVEYTNDLLSRFMSRYHQMLLMMAIDLYGLGDQYVAINPDGSLSVISPELAEITPDDLDYRRYASVKITTRLDKYTITDEYSEQGRTVKVVQGYATGGGGKAVSEQRFENLIGTLPIVHFANDRGTNELYGRPIYEALYKLMSRYDDLIEKAIDGAELMGNPVPVFEGMENINETVSANKTQDDETYTDSDGNEETRTLLRFDRLSAIFVGKGGAFNFKSPAGGFTGDIRNMLKALFLLMLDYTRVPEAVWGGAINSSKASADAQMPPFYQYIDGRRMALEGIGADEGLGLQPKGGLYQLIDVWLRTKALTDPRVVVGPTAIEWPELEAENGELNLKWVSYLRGMGLLDDETVLRLFGQLDDPAAVLEQARKEAEERQAKQEEFQARLQDEQQRAAQDNTQGAGAETDETSGGRVTPLPDESEPEERAA